ncbi:MULTISPECIES: LacI family DNA-binding transcriptional regulator [Paenibacillus]|uniref:LacI family transcriptional regulator n=1 Tax=Paenibacillus vini TaxID=1476024 RepID=A0ABQ4M9L8_9BACL|nr:MULTISPECIES: LacI family DNA-binding transcriptional regulator [Paenibacillus]MBQ4899731.1 LacI family DNA-binding transcriptional regulator [Paenibacillus sp. Marseille-P2973]MDN4068923.1 LacI family DNA-binding transcriptional regulator [Paenibacillus vini]GIP52691.1 LacI family transcriptional regulator [Paenibacillus vini]
MVRTIRDIAKSAGVSVSTVSKVINNYPNVSDKTKERVLRVVREEQFVPNSTARGLVKGSTQTLGLFLTTGLTHPYFVQLLAGLEESLKESGYDLIYLAQIDWNPEYSLVRHCRSRNVDGVLIFGFQRNDLNFDEMLQSEIPTMFIDLDLIGSRAGFITSDNVDSMRQAVSYLTGLGHRKIAFVAGYQDSYVGKLRFEGYRQGIQESDLPYSSEYTFFGDFTRDSGYAAMKQFLECSAPPTAVICCSDMSALGVIEAAAEAGLTVPQDLSVIGFDDIEISRYTNPPLTTIRQDFQTIGRQAVLQLDQLIRTPHIAPPTLIIPTELIIRGSCGICRDSE